MQSKVQGRVANLYASDGLARGNHRDRRQLLQAGMVPGLQVQVCRYSLFRHRASERHGDVGLAAQTTAGTI